MKFDRDPQKSRKNQAKHKVSFDEAETIFADPYFIAFADDAHSFDELRYLIIGESAQRRVLLVVYTERGEITRLISARAATARERKFYEEEKYSALG